MSDNREYLLNEPYQILVSLEYFFVHFIGQRLIKLFISSDMSHFLTDDLINLPIEKNVQLLFFVVYTQAFL